MLRLVTTAGAVALAGLLGGCAQMEEGFDDILGRTGMTGTTFDCDGGRELQVSFADGGREAVLRSGGETERLELVDTREAGDTRLYENRAGSVRMIDEGDEIHVRIEGQENFDNCQPEDDDYRRL